MRKIQYSPEAIVRIPNIFGFGSEGDVVLTSNVGWTSDHSYNNLTINSGVVLQPSNSRLFVKETLTIEGIIRNNGGDASGGTQGAPSTVRSLRGGARGVAGRATVGAGNAAPDTEYYCGAAAGIGGDADGWGVGFANGYGGQAAWRENFITAISALTYYQTAVFAFGGGRGGGGGANAVADGFSGGGGTGGGFIMLIAKTIILNGSIEAIGGNGGNAVAGTGNKGGGGGGGGGLVILVYKTLVENGAITVTGGAAGAGLGTGDPGNAGSIGVIIRLAPFAG